jgi:hypothetical protein
MRVAEIVSSRADEDAVNVARTFAQFATWLTAISERMH